MYTIKQAASRSGVTIQLLRAWERRYGVVEPARTQAGYRLYDEEAIDRLRVMRRLIDSGWTPSTAARHIHDMDAAAIGELLAEMPARPELVGQPDRETAGALGEAFVSSAAALDEPGFEAVLDDMFMRGSFEQVASGLVMPALVALGEGWQEGRLDVAAEHAAAGAVQRRLGAAFMAAGRPIDESNVVLVGLPPGARHDLGALAFATALRRRGVTVRYLGADLPLQDWLDAAVRTSAAAVVIGVVIASDVDPAERVAHAVRAANPRLIIAFGGRAAADVDLSAAEPAMVLPDDLVGAVDAMRAALDGQPERYARLRGGSKKGSGTTVAAARPRRPSTVHSSSTRDPGSS